MSATRVFQVITRMVRGGAQRIVLDLLARLPRAEFRQTLVCGGEEAVPADVEVRRVPDLVREVRPVRDVRAAARLAALFLSRRPHVVHAHTYKAGVLSSVAARLADVPAVIFTPHGHIFARGARIPGVPAGGWKRDLLRWITRGAQACAHRVTALSEADLHEQLALGLSPPSKYGVVRNGIDLARFSGSAVPREGGPVVGAVGRFSEEKGHAVLIDAFARVRELLPGARLVLVGYGDLEAALRARVRERSLDGAVTFTGERESAELLPTFDLFVQPSLYESQGMAIVEAMAAGRPVVATDVGGVRDVVQDGETGLLVPAGDPGALAGALLRLAGDRRWAGEMAERARVRVARLFPVERMVDDYARLYRTLLGRKRNGAANSSARPGMC